MQVRILLSVLTFRINRRYVTADPPFISIDLDHSDSGREGCTVSTLTISSEPKDWRGAVQVCTLLLTRKHRCFTICMIVSPIGMVLSPIDIVVSAKDMVDSPITIFASPVDMVLLPTDMVLSLTDMVH